MKTFLASHHWHFIIMLLFLVTISTQSPANMLIGLIMLLGFMAAAFSMLVFLRLGVYRQLLIFLTLLQVFTLAIKASYGLANTTILALLPTVYLGGMLISVFLLGVQGKISFKFSLLDTLVLFFFVLDFMQVFNPYLDALDDQRFFIIGLRGFWQRSFLGLAYFVIRWLGMSSFRFNTIVRVIAYTTALGSIYALLQQLFGFDLLEQTYRLEQIANDPLLEGLYISRAVGFLGSPFTFGLISATGFACGIYLFNSVLLSKQERFISIASVLLNITAVVLSGSRTTYFSLIVTYVFLVLIMRVPLLFASWHLLKTTMAVIVALTLLFIVFPDSIPVRYSIERMNSVKEIFATDNSITDMNFIIRRQLIAASVPMILSNPFGYGSGIFNGGSNPDGLVSVNGYSTFIDNEFIGIALELGIIGVFLFLAIVGIALHRCYLALRHPTWRNPARLLAAIVVINSVAGVGGQWLAAYPINIIFWVLLGTIAGLPISLHPLRYFASSHKK